MGEKSIRIYTFKYSFRDKIKGRKENLGEKSKLVIKGQSLNSAKPTLEVALIDSRGMSYGHRITLHQENGIYKIPIDQLSPTQFAIVPRPYPGFMSWLAPYWPSDSLETEAIETLQISLVPATDDYQPEPLEYYLQEIWLE